MGICPWRETTPFRPALDQWWQKAQLECLELENSQQDPMVFPEGGKAFGTSSSQSGNRLPRELVDSPSVEILKQRLNKHLLEMLQEDSLL